MLRGDRKVEETDRRYGLDLKKFTNHKKVFPWMFVLKIILGLSLILAAFYFSKVLEKETSIDESSDTVEIEFQPDQY